MTRPEKALLMYATPKESDSYQVYRKPTKEGLKELADIVDYEKMRRLKVQSELTRLLDTKAARKQHNKTTMM